MSEKIYEQEIAIAQIAATIACGAWSNPEAVNGYTLTTEQCVEEAFKVLEIVKQKLKQTK